MNGSAATSSPTCFMTAQTRFPANVAPSAVSNAIFSFAPHSTCVFVFSSSAQYAMEGRISEDGVPG